MYFILQDTDEIEIYQMEKLLVHSRQDTYISTFDIYGISDYKLKDAIPVGDLDFVKTFLKRVYGSNEMPPIEIPSVLLHQDIVKRDYHFVMGKDIPKNGRYFIKDATELKNFSFNGDIDMIQGFIERDHNYVLSSIVEILSEYRVIVLNDKIQCIQYYDGNPVILPDAQFIQKVVNRYMTDNSRPKSYIADFGVNSNLETFLIELQPSVSFGTYGYFAENLRYIYKLGLDYYINLIKDKEN